MKFRFHIHGTVEIEADSTWEAEEILADMDINEMVDVDVDVIDEEDEG